MPPFHPRLYLIIDPDHIPGGNIQKILQQTIPAGVTAVQLRSKTASTKDFFRLAQETLMFLSPFQIPLIINDRVDIALCVGAQGVHLGQNDFPICEARRLLGKDAIIGLSIQNLSQALALAKDKEQATIDYVGVGPIFATKSKPDANAPMGLKTLFRICQMMTCKVVAIGGIQTKNAAQVIQAGAEGIAIISAICQAKNPTYMTRALRNQIERAYLQQKENTHETVP